VYLRSVSKNIFRNIKLLTTSGMLQESPS